MSIELLDGSHKGRRIVVTRDEFEAWLNNPAHDRAEATREYLKMLLGRIPPSREFKKGMAAR
jgi:hypothetical protein